MAKKAKSTVTKAAQTLGSRGGKVGGPARAQALTKQQRIEIAKKGGHARQKKNR